MRKLILLVWLLLPVVVGFYHAGPGQARVVLDNIHKTLATADRAAADGEWNVAEREYEAALALLPPDRISESRRVRLERSKVQMMNRKLPEAHQDLKSLVDELQEDSAADPQLFSETRAALANSQYYMAWLMRLEGQPRDLWEPEIEGSRQTFRHLAEQAIGSGDEALAKRFREDLEASIRLARMDLNDLQGLPLPSQ